MSSLIAINNGLIPTMTTATRDSQVIEMWLSQKSVTTQRQYKSVIKGFLALINKPLKSVTYDDLVLWLNSIGHNSHNTQRGKISVVKSLFSFCEKLGYTVFNVAKIMKQPKEQSTIQERILNKDEVTSLINNIDNLRDKLIAKTAYVLGLRVSELVNLKWSDVFNQDDKIMIKVLGKGAKIRFLIIPNNLYNELLNLKKDGIDYIFISRKKQGKLTATQAYRIIRDNAKKSLNKRVSPHYLRHSHATHSLKNGCDLSLLSNNLGHGNIAITSRYLHCTQDDCSSNYLDVA